MAPGLEGAVGVAKRRATLIEAERSIPGQSQYGYCEDRKIGIAAC